MKAQEIVLAVMSDVQGLAKKDRNQSQGFNFRGIDAVMNAVGPSLRKHGGFIVPALDSVEYSTATTSKGAVQNVARVVVTYAVHGSEGSPLLGSVAAEAFDSGDKATAKAMSVAYRTFLLQLLCLPTDEPDPDSHTYEATVRDWVAEAQGLNIDGLRALYVDAVKAGASKAVLAELTKLGKNG